MQKETGFDSGSSPWSLPLLKEGGTALWRCLKLFCRQELIPPAFK